MALNEFIDRVANKGLVWQNRFAVEITGPGGNGDRNINLFAESVSMPGQNVRTTEDDLRFGPARDHAQSFTYGDISMTFICTPGMPEKVFFEDWQELIISKGNNEWQAKFYKDYIGQIAIRQLDKNDFIKYTIIVHEAFPKTINAQEFSLTSTDVYQTVSIDFAYRWWDSIHAKPSGRSAGTAPAFVDTFDAFSGGRGARETRATDDFVWAHRNILATGADAASPGTLPDFPGKAIK